MDTLALGIIAIGVVAAIGVVLVAMTDSGGEASATSAPAEPSTPQPEQSRAKTRRRRARAQVAPPLATSAPRQRANGYSPLVPGDDPLLAGFLQMVSGELDTLRQQQEQIQRRLKLIDGISELVREMTPSNASRVTNHNPDASNGTGSRPVKAG